MWLTLQLVLYWNWTCSFLFYGWRLHQCGHETGVVFCSNPFNSKNNFMAEVKLSMMSSPLGRDCLSDIMKAYPWQQKPKVVPFLFHALYSVGRLKITLKHCRKSETWGQVSLFCRGESRFSKRLGQFSQGHMASEWSGGSPTQADGGVHELSVCISVSVMPDMWLKTLLRKVQAADQHCWHLLGTW